MSWPMPAMTRRLSLGPRLVQAGVALVALERMDRDERSSGAGPDAARARRQMDFDDGRWCARECLAACAPELARATVAVGADRAPRWPAGVVGSISHAARYVLAAVARRETASCIGIDVAPWLDDAAPARIGAAIAAPGELESLSGGSGWPPARCLTLLFSAKEAIFKALYPMVGHMFGFEYARLTRVVPDNAASGRFEGHLTLPLGPLPAQWPLVGRYECRDDAAFTTLIHSAGLRA